MTPSRLRTFALCGVVAGLLAFVYVALWMRAAGYREPTAPSGWRDLEHVDGV